MTEFAILTHIMRGEHLAVLDDWVDFFGSSPSRLIAVGPPDPGVQESIQSWGKKRNVPIVLAAACEAKDILPNETKYLNHQFEVAATDLVALIKLDTFPAREGYSDWFSESLYLMRSTGAQFITGSTKPFRADEATVDPDFLLTRRVSNNFLVIEAPVWRRFQKLGSKLNHDFGRYFTEGAIEKICERDGDFGIRRLNSSNWRVFHTQAWGQEATRVRDAVKAGGRVLKPFLEGYQDDLFGRPLWEQYFMYAKPSRLKIWRIAFGRWRKAFLAKKVASSLSPPN